jgi:anaerobic magnesium-protoporphyrin IX monomethyl ester cyclase
MHEDARVTSGEDMARSLYRAEPGRGTFHGHGEPEPIGLEYLAGALVRRGFGCSFLGSSRCDLIDAEGETRLALFSVVTGSYAAVRKQAAAAQRRGVLTAIGGHHASASPMTVAHGPFDYVVQGEGEDVVLALAEATLHGRRDALTSFQHERAGNSMIVRGARLQDLDAYPWPLRSESRLGSYLLYDLMWPPTTRQRNVAIMLTSRGCRYSCDFCASATVWGLGVRHRSKENVVAELRDLKERYGTNTVVIIDQSFGQDAAWTLDLCRAIKVANLGLTWYHQSNLEIDRDVLAAMADAGCTKVGFGLEGLSPSAIERIKPSNPTSLAEINDLFDYCTSLGLFVKAYTILGFPWETEDTVKEYVDWLPRLRANQVKISYMTPFPGTPYWSQYKAQLISHNWGDFDTVRMPVVHNPNIPVERYHQIREELLRTFYGSEMYTEGVRRMTSMFPRSMESYREFAGFLRSFNLINGREPWLSDVSFRDGAMGVLPANG